MQSFRAVEHTTDIGLELCADDNAELLSSCINGLLWIYGLPPQTASEEKINIELQSSDTETVLVDWFNELIYRIQTDKFYPAGVKSVFLEKGILKAVLCGKYFPAGLKLNREVKAATYHSLELKKSDEGLRLVIFFDL